MPNDSAQTPPCRLCEAAPTTKVMPAPARPMWHCPYCDLVFVDESALPARDRERDRYLQHHNSIDDPGYVATFDRIREAVRDHAAAQPNPSILDFGCGPTPVLVELLKRDGFNATDYDPFFAPSFVDGASFDIITCVETAEHFAHPRATFARIAALLRPRGTFIMQTQWHAGPASIHHWWYARDATHVAFYSAETLTIIANLLEAETLDVLSDGLCAFRHCRVSPT